LENFSSAESYKVVQKENHEADERKKNSEKNTFKKENNLFSLC